MTVDGKLILACIGTQTPTNHAPLPARPRTLQHVCAHSHSRLRVSCRCRQAGHEFVGHLQPSTTSTAAVLACRMHLGGCVGVHGPFREHGSRALPSFQNMRTCVSN